MNKTNVVELLLVEDNPQDLALALRALRKANLANRVQVVRDGAEALDFVFGQGAFAGRKLSDGPKVILLDLKLPKVDGLEVFARHQGRSAHQDNPGGRAYTRRRSRATWSRVTNSG